MILWKRFTFLWMVEQHFDLDEIFQVEDLLMEWSATTAETP
jgi:hypothetical protein